MSLCVKYLQVSSQMAQLYSSTATCLAVKRLPALSLTLCLELLGAVIIDQLHQVINTFTLTVSMSRLQHGFYLNLCQLWTINQNVMFR